MTGHDSGSSLTRRDFLWLATAMGGAAALASFLDACSRAGVNLETLPASTSPTGLPVHTLAQPTKPPTAPTPEQVQPTETQPAPTGTATQAPEDGLARVAFVKTNDRAKGLRIAVDLLAINPVAGQRVFLKPNFNSADPPPGSTHPDMLIALVKALQDMGAEHITVGDRSGMGDTRQVMQQLGVFDLAGTMGFDVVVFDELGPEDWVRIQPPGAHWSSGFPFARPALEAAALVQTCCLKTHRYGGHFTMSLKNSVGMVAKGNLQDGHDYMQELHASPHQRRMIAEINAAYAPALIVLDGLEAFVSGGPDKGERVSPQVILAGTDRIAIDAAGVALLRYFGCRTEAGQGKIFEQEQIARAVDLGLGVDSPEKIQFLTGDKDSEAYSQEIQAILLAA
jgi:uncharacterized protein (DUF362 family)